ncbi:MAG: sigma 54-interacting transcriptional regulator [Candidatus Hydrogenedentes bacterium]|nr:sigma 54-interacting transcriptional regulator [Candidatus Hydrogenedentota bacterium]
MPNSILFSLDGLDTGWSAIADRGQPISLRLGRGQESDLIVPHTIPEELRASVSRVHARFFRHGNVFWVEDLGSVNFTFVNERIVLSPTKVELPVTLRLGEVVIRITHENLSQRLLDSVQSTWLGATNTGATETHRFALPELHSDRVLREIGGRLHWAGALMHLAGLVGSARRADDAEAQFRHLMALHLSAQRVELLLDQPASRIRGELRGRNLSEDSTLAVRRILEVSPRPESVMRVDLCEPASFAWVLRYPYQGEEHASVLVARGIAPKYREDNMEDVHTVVAVALRMMDPFVRTLRELETHRAATPCAIRHEISSPMKDLCEGGRIWGESPSFRTSLYYAEQAATRYLPAQRHDRKLSVVFFLGESGTGKSAMARLMHQASNHRAARFEEINCAAIPVTLAESELFGYEKGAHDKAFSAKPGLFEIAESGTLFLDEIGKTSKDFQGKLLKVLDTGEFRRLGGTQVRTTNCYVILAASEDPKELCDKGLLLEELWYRTNALTITLPPLRERGEDIALLVNKQIEALNSTLPEDKRKHVTRQVMGLFRSYPWPGNVRELMQYVEVAHALCPPDTNEITVQDLPQNILRALGIEKLTSSLPLALTDTSKPLDDLVSSLEREYFARMIKECSGNLTEVARRSKKSYQTVHTKLKTFRAWLESDDESLIQEKDKLRSIAGPYWSVIQRDDDQGVPQEV